MIPDAVQVIIRNRRRPRWQAWVVLVIISAFVLGACGVFGLDVAPKWGATLAMAGVGAAIGAVIFAVFAPTPVSLMKLTDVLETRPAGRAFRPTEIVRVEFGPDPAEDYVDLPIPIRLCEVRVVPLLREPIRLIASVGDATRLRDWAVRKGVRVFDPQDALAGSACSDEGEAETHRSDGP